MVAYRHGRRAGGLAIHQSFVAAVEERLGAGAPDETPVVIELLR
ncbi:MAG: hypothetical protein ACRDTC_10975 [Pseudonocardiaceae bacterium]